MTVQRQYTLPNCNLKLEGLNTGDDTDPMAPLTVVLNSECIFPGTPHVLSGGREFLDALVKTVSDYAQSLLSGIPYPLPEEVSAAQPVALKPGEHHRHHLMATVTAADGTATRQTLELNSVQLFDLVEAVDQLLADTLTLPDLTLQLSSLARRHVRPAEPMAQRAVPAAVGLSTLAAAAALFFLPPVPEFEVQRRESEGAALSELVEEEAANLAEADSSPDGSETATGDRSDGADPDDDATAADPIAAGVALDRLATAAAITDADTLSELAAELEDSLADALVAEVAFEDVLIYRVAVSESGDILGYKYENDAALINIDSTPLPELTFIPVEPTATTDEAVAQFLVTFDEAGEVTAEPIDADELTDADSEE